MDTLLPGAHAPDFLLPAIPGKPAMRLSDLRGQPVVLAFSSPEWDPARAEELLQTNRLLGQAGFTGKLLGVARDGVWCHTTFTDGSIHFPLLTGSELDADAAQQYGAAGKQALFALDSEGIIRWSHVAAPGVSLRAEELLAGIQSLGAKTNTGLTRREFVGAAMGIALALSLFQLPVRAEDTQVTVPDTLNSLRSPSLVGTVPVTLMVNGTAHPLQIEPRVTLLDALRERLGLTGTKKGCDHGQCGSCTVHVDGRRINSCLALAIAQQGKQITTIEGLAQGDALHPMQAAFIQHDGFQCGFCTPGQIMSAVALLQEPVGPEDSDVRENMSGNLCRCGAYPNIVAAVQDVRKGGSNAPV